MNQKLLTKNKLFNLENLNYNTANILNKLIKLINI